MAEITINEYLAVDGQWHGPSNVEYRIYSLNDWLSSDDQFHPQGTPFDLALSQNVYLSGDCDVDGLDLTIPEVVIESTEDATINPGVNLMLCLFNKATDRLITVLAPRITIPSSPTTTDWPTLFARAEATLPASTTNATISGTVTAGAFVGDGSGLTNLQVVRTFHGRQGTVTLQSSDLNGLSGAGLSGIGAGTGGVINTGTTTIGGDSDANGVGVVVLQTRGLNRLTVNNDGTLTAEGTKLTLGDTTVGASSRLDLTTKPTNTATAGRLWNVYSQTFGLSGGPGGEANYDNDTCQVGAYNTGASGAKIISGLVNFGWANEARFYTGTNFQSEHYHTWSSPDGLITFRPFSWVTSHSNADTVFGFRGSIELFEDVSDGQGQWAIINRNGSHGFNLDIEPDSYIAFANDNSTAIVFRNAANTGNITPVYVDGSDRTVIGLSGSSDVLIDADTATASTINAFVFGNRNTPTTAVKFDFSNQMYFQVNGNVIANLTGTLFELRAAQIWDVDNTYDLGKTGGTNLRPRDIYAGRDVYVGGVLKLTDGTVKNVEVGADDSGGTGFRMLRVAN